MHKAGSAVGGAASAVDILTLNACAELCIHMQTSNAGTATIYSHRLLAIRIPES